MAKISAWLALRPCTTTSWKPMIGNPHVARTCGPVRVARDLVLRMRRPEQVAADLDWLYGYKAPG